MFKLEYHKKTSLLTRNLLFTHLQKTWRRHYNSNRHYFNSRAEYQKQIHTQRNKAKFTIIHYKTGLECAEEVNKMFFEVTSLGREASLKTNLTSVMYIHLSSIYSI